MSIHTLLEPGWMWTLAWLAVWAIVARIAYPPETDCGPDI